MLRKSGICLITIFIFFNCFYGELFAQNNGNNLLFQGMHNIQAGDAAALALGQAMTGRYGTLNSLYYNPAGSGGIDEYKVSVTGAFTSSTFRKNNVWYPGSPRLNLSLLLDGLLTYREDQSGLWANDLINRNFPNAWDLSQFGQPDMGNDPYDEDVADFKSEESTVDFSNLAIVFPLSLPQMKLTAGLIFSRNDVYNVDWNGTQLDPHFSAPGTQPVADTLRSNWSVYNRSRKNKLNQMGVVIGSEPFSELALGIRVNYLFGETEDFLSLDRVGYFLFENISGTNNWSFTFEDQQYLKKGNSQISAFSTELGAMLVLDAFTFGMQFGFPYTIYRDWEYTNVISDSGSVKTLSDKTRDELEMPFKIAVGAAFSPYDNLVFMLDYQYSPLTQSKMNIGSQDSLFGIQNYADQRVYAAGIEYQPTEGLFLRAGYQNKSASFIPEANAVQDRGPIASTYSLGVGYCLGPGQVDLTYFRTSFKFCDVYLNNRNYTYESHDAVYLTFSVNPFSL